MKFAEASNRTFEDIAAYIQFAQLRFLMILEGYKLIKRHSALKIRAVKLL